MEHLGQRWKKLPDKPRRVLTFIIGSLLIIVAGLIGWIPGPGGMIPFLLGIAVLATEFEWAERFRDRVLAWLKYAGKLVRRHPFVSALLIGAAAACVGLCVYVFYKNII